MGDYLIILFFFFDQMFLFEAKSYFGNRHSKSMMMILMMMMMTMIMMTVMLMTIIDNKDDDNDDDNNDDDDDNVTCFIVPEFNFIYNYAYFNGAHVHFIVAAVMSADISTSLITWRWGEYSVNLCSSISTRRKTRRMYI